MLGLTNELLIDDLYAERDELRAEIQRLRTEIDDATDAAKMWQAENERLQTQVEWWKTRAEAYESLANRLSETPAVHVADRVRELDAEG